ncbi:hypothetical protein B0T24DRAFT_572633 [Lasiosphaeria ovina]|uniref:Uncharacterized protein n=1 Tax=Lasiosphaeria ovina TaxID=92902 RepID=A0AAE0KFV6_9PEZI|nr:hypothetical protein B0T24DRAFT_572633 [Lasiosphaeria ovina]
MASPSPKSVIVTGGASGIGLAMSRHFASSGHRVAILDVNGDSGPATAAAVAAEFPQARVSFRKCDVSSWADQAAAFEHVYRDHGGRIDVVMANAGVSEQGATTLVHRLDEEEDSPSPPNLATININLVGTIYSVKLAVHYMRKGGKAGGDEGASRGSIICSASNAGLYALPVAPLYATSKFGVVGLVRSTARVLARLDIQINALAPAVLDTNIAPNKDLFKHMVVTPMSTLIRGVDGFLADPGLTGAVAEIHGDSVTIRPPHEYVDTESEQNIETFWTLGYA